MELEIIAAEGGKMHAKVSGVAYDGGLIAQAWSPVPVAVDLAGLTMAPQIPLLDGHENTTSARLGECQATTDGRELRIEGAITAPGERARAIVEAGRETRWQLSIGALNLKARRIPAGETTAVNGRAVAGPAYIVTEAMLREVSVVAVGANAGTSLNISAAWSMDFVAPDEGVNMKAEAATTKTKEDIMADITTQQAAPAIDTDEIKAQAIKAERDRVSAIQAVCAGEMHDIEAKAISEGWSVEKTTAEALKAVRAARSAKTPDAPCATQKDGDADLKAIEAALCLQGGVTEDRVLASYGEQTVDKADRMRSWGLKALLASAMDAEGVACGRELDIRAAISTVSVPQILSSVAGKVLRQAYETAPAFATKCSAIGSVSDFKDALRVRVSDLGDLEPVGADAEVADSSLGEDAPSVRALTYAKLVTLSRQMIINDDLGAFLQIPQLFGARAAALPDKLLAAALAANRIGTQDFFSATNGNLLSSKALNAANLKTAYGTLRGMTAADGKPINVVPRYLIVPVELELLARELVSSNTIVISGSTDKERGSYNVISGLGLEVVASPYLSATSATTWYLAADKGTAPWEVSYLYGRQAPVVEQGEADYTHLAVYFRVHTDLGVSLLDPKAAVKCTA